MNKQQYESLSDDSQLDQTRRGQIAALWWYQARGFGSLNFQQKGVFYG